MSFNYVHRLIEAPAGVPVNPFHSVPDILRYLQGAGAEIEFDLMSHGGFDGKL